MTGPELKTRRLALGLTQAGLAEALHVSPVTIGRYEMPSKGTRYPIPWWIEGQLQILLDNQAKQEDEPIHKPEEAQP